MTQSDASCAFLSVARFRAAACGRWRSQTPYGESANVPGKFELAVLFYVGCLAFYAAGSADAAAAVLA